MKNTSQQPLKRKWTGPNEKRNTIVSESLIRRVTSDRIYIKVALYITLSIVTTLVHFLVLYQVYLLLIKITTQFENVQYPNNSYFQSAH